MRIRYLASARLEMNATVRHYQAVNPRLGRDFRAAVRETMALIKRNPSFSEVVDEDIRCATTSGFPYGIYFQWRAKELLIVTVAHLHRQPGPWRGRV